MTPWQVIEEALAHKKPPRSPQWLADQLHVKIQVVSNWKSRGVPTARYREIASALDLSVDQIEGLEPLPWEKAGEWPFEDRGLFDRVKALRQDQRLELQGVLRRMVLEFEQEAARVFTGGVEAEQHTTRTPVLHEPPVSYPVPQQERGTGAKRYPALEEAALPNEEHGSTSHRRRPPAQGGGRGR